MWNIVVDTSWCVLVDSKPISHLHSSGSSKIGGCTGYYVMTLSPMFVLATLCTSRHTHWKMQRYIQNTMARRRRRRRKRRRRIYVHSSRFWLMQDESAMASKSKPQMIMPMNHESRYIAIEQTSQYRASNVPLCYVQ